MRTFASTHGPAPIIRVALRAVQAGHSAVLDFGFWARDGRSFLVWLAEALGARAS